MKTVVAICVYNRFHNVKTWINCWSQCNTGNAQLVIVHNHYGNENDERKYADYCAANQVTYIGRPGPGFDIGAFQDVCRNRLPGFPDYDFLLWCTDDVLPMDKGFIGLFENAMSQPGVGLAAMDISDEYVRHVRTTGFCVSRKTAEQIVFRHDPFLTKEQCYGFEHRDGAGTLYNQILAMGLQAVTVLAGDQPPLWDSGFPQRINRQWEHDLVFSQSNRGEDKVVVICPVYNMYPQIISALICQTHQNWELLLINNGTQLNGLDEIVKGYDDKRINFIVYPEQTGNYGHHLRAWALESIRNGELVKDADYVVITNADNYYCPTFAQSMITAFKTHSEAIACYCSDMVHSYLNWATQACWLERGHIDCGGVMIKKDIACSVSWRSIEHSSDWIYFNDIIQQYGASKWVKVPGTLFVHN